MNSRLMLFGFVYILRAPLPCGILPDLVFQRSACASVCLAYRSKQQSVQLFRQRTSFNAALVLFEHEKGTYCSQPRPADPGVTDLNLTLRRFLAYVNVWDVAASPAYTPDRALSLQNLRNMQNIYFSLLLFCVWGF